MKIEMTGISPRNEFGMVLVTFSLHVRRDQAWDGGKLDVFLPASDSIAEIKRVGLEHLRRFAAEILEFPANERPADDPDSTEGIKATLGANIVDDAETA